MCIKQFKQNKMEKMKDFGNFIRNTRKDKNIPLKSVAIDLGVTHNHLSSVELGQVSFNPKNIDCLALALGLDKNLLKSRWLANKFYKIVEDSGITEHVVAEESMAHALKLIDNLRDMELKREQRKTLN